MTAHHSVDSRPHLDKPLPPYGVVRGSDAALRVAGGGAARGECGAFLLALLGARGQGGGLGWTAEKNNINIIGLP